MKPFNYEDFCNGAIAKNSSGQEYKCLYVGRYMMLIETNGAEIAFPIAEIQGKGDARINPWGLKGVRKSGWVNIYPGPYSTATIYETRAQADRASIGLNPGTKRIDCIQIEWEE